MRVSRALAQVKRGWAFRRPPEELVDPGLHALTQGWRGLDLHYLDPAVHPRLWEDVVGRADVFVRCFAEDEMLVECCNRAGRADFACFDAHGVFTARECCTIGAGLADPLAGLRQTDSCNP